MSENVEETLVIDMVEEPFDVNGEERRDESLFPSCLDVVAEGESGVEAGGVGTTAKLVERHELVASEVVGDAASDDLLDEFA